eukprot:TRINITY_DN68133_c0_g1_i1.p1 TRINITY_DN68133_c0_g1~~TRINITY_DN68133_c0_g1_i1.p1  ORF type:complete len:364 (+),score=59.24 TRINITY_DN68133_c0_g1_i1:58-1092(+)
MAFASPAASPRASDAATYGAIHDLSFDRAGRRFATASSDGVVRVWTSESQTLVNELRAKQTRAAPVVSLDWGMLYGGRCFLASGASDGHVAVWRDGGAAAGWQLVHEVYVTGAAGALGFSPAVDPSAGKDAVAQAGILLAIAGADALGIVTVLLRKEASSPTTGGGGSGEQWLQASAFPAHPGGVTCLTWAPFSSPTALASGPAVSRGGRVPLPPRRLATGGLDGVVRIWHGDAKGSSWVKQHELIDDARHRGSVRDVAWKPNDGIPGGCIASCTEEGCVAIWMQEAEGRPWSLRQAWQVVPDARRLAWSEGGIVLSVAVGESGSEVYKETSEGWQRLSSELNT